MSGLLDAVEAAIPGSLRPADEIARAAVEAVATWLDENGGYTKVANILRAEMAPPKPTRTCGCIHCPCPRCHESVPDCAGSVAPPDPLTGLIVNWMGSKATGTPYGDAEQLADVLARAARQLIAAEIVAEADRLAELGNDDAARYFRLAARTVRSPR